MLIVVTAFKLVAEIALFALCGQWLLGFLTSTRRNGNPFYAFLKLLGHPWVSAARWLSPKIVLDRHLPLVAFFLMLIIWTAASLAKIGICLKTGVNLCK
jgi:hypothetical protein